MTTKQKRPPISSLSFIFFTSFLILVLIGLGTWQLERKKEKEVLLYSLATAWQDEVRNVDDIKTPIPLKPLYAMGRYMPGKTIFLQAKTHKGKSGVYVLDVFQTQKGQHILVQRGWSSKERHTLPPGPLKLEGIVRLPSPPTYFQPLNKPPIYFWIDLKGLSQEVNLPLVPYYLVAKTSHDVEIHPTDPMPLPPNNHLGYAMTWYSLAFALLGMLLWSLKNRFHKENL